MGSKKINSRNYTVNKKEKESTFIIEGWSIVSDYLSKQPQRIRSITCSPRDVAKVESLLRTVKEKATQVELIVDKGVISAVIGEKVLSFVDWEESERAREEDVVLVLDHITDTRNLGALIRSAAFFGIKSIFIPEKRQASLTQGVISTSQSGLCSSDLVSVVNVSRCIEYLKKEGFWILGADGSGEDFKNHSDRFNRVALVLGSEDKGISQNVRKKCDLLVAIRGSGSVESLNVSVAGGILMQEYGCKR